MVSRGDSGPAGGIRLRPILLVNPRTDTAFADMARQELADCPEDDPAVLERRLRERYPKAKVHVRSLSNEPATVWYIYRDGQWTRPT
jgi:hypothetical protein